MSTIPYMPLYISDYLADTAHLTTLEHGIYLLLIMNYWQTGKPLPNNDKKLARIVHLSSRKFSKMKPTVTEFFSITDTEWRHERIEKELAIFREKSEKARLAGQLSAQKRKKNKSTTVEQPLNERSTSAERTFNHTDTDTDAYINTDYYHMNDSNCENAPDGDVFTNAAVDEKIECESTTQKPPPCPHQEIISLYHEMLPNNPAVQKWTPVRQRHLQARWKEHPDLVFWKKYFTYIGKSDFLTGKIEGRHGRCFLPGLAWLIKAENFAKVLEQNYHVS